MIVPAAQRLFWLDLATLHTGFSFCKASKNNAVHGPPANKPEVSLQLFLCWAQAVIQYIYMMLDLLC